MTNEERIERLRKCATFNVCNPETCDLWYEDDCRSILLKDAAHALEAAEKRIKKLESQAAFFDAEKQNYQENIEYRDERIKELEAQLPKEGEWLRTDAFPHRVYCSCCYKTYVPNENWQIWQDDADNFGLPRNYCPNCGARMKGEKE